MYSNNHHCRNIVTKMTYIPRAGGEDESVPRPLTSTETCCLALSNVRCRSIACLLQHLTKKLTDAVLVMMKNLIRNGKTKLAIFGSEDLCHTQDQSSGQGYHGARRGGGDDPSSIAAGDARSILLPGTVRRRGPGLRGASRPGPHLKCRAGQRCCKRLPSAEPALGGPLRVRASTCPHPLSPHGVRLLGHHQRAVATAAAAVATAYAAITTVAAVPAAIPVAPAILAALAASTATQTSAAWLACRTPGPQALPSPKGLCAGAPAGRPTDSARTTKLLGARAGGLRCDAQAGPYQACTRRSSCALATGLLLILRAGVPAPPQGFAEDGG